MMQVDRLGRGKSLLCAASLLAAVAALPSMSCAGKAHSDTMNAGAPSGSIAGDPNVAAGAGGDAPSAGGESNGGASAGAGRAGCQGYNFTSLSGACSPIGQSLSFKGEFKSCIPLGGQRTDCQDKACVCGADGTWWCGCPCLAPAEQLYSAADVLATLSIACSCVDHVGTCALVDQGAAGEGGAVAR